MKVNKSAVNRENLDLSLITGGMEKISNQAWAKELAGRVVRILKNKQRMQPDALEQLPDYLGALRDPDSRLSVAKGRVILGAFAAWWVWKILRTVRKLNE